MPDVSIRLTETEYEKVKRVKRDFPSSNRKVIGAALDGWDLLTDEQKTIAVRKQADDADDEDETRSNAA
jgi:hypothetical protein